MFFIPSLQHTFTNDYLVCVFLIQNTYSAIAFYSQFFKKLYPLETEYKLKVCMTLRRPFGRLLNVLCTPCVQVVISLIKEVL